MNVEKINYVMKKYDNDSILLDISNGIAKLTTLNNTKNIVDMSHNILHTISMHSDIIVQHEKLTQLSDVVTKLKAHLNTYNDVLTIDKLLNTINIQKLKIQTINDDGKEKNENNDIAIDDINDKHKSKISNTNVTYFIMLFLFFLICIFILFI